METTYDAQRTALDIKAQTLVANGIRNTHSAPAGTLCLSKSVSQSVSQTDRDTGMAQHFIDFLNLTQRRAGGSVLRTALIEWALYLSAPIELSV